jgi:hypothetical protein
MPTIVGDVSSLLMPASSFRSSTIDSSPSSSKEQSANQILPCRTLPAIALKTTSPSSLIP